MKLSEHLGVDVAAMAEQDADEIIAAVGAREAANDPAPEATRTEDAPNCYLCIELTPLFSGWRETLKDLSTGQLFELAARSPHLFKREWTSFMTLEAARIHSKQGWTLEIIPLVVEFNPILGF